MDDTTKLEFLKHNLQRGHTSSQDLYLQHLLEQAKLETALMGLEECDEKDGIEIDYAAFLYRSRADLSSDKKMPRHLDYRIKNLLWHQRGGST